MSIVSWNIHGQLMLNCADASFWNIIERHDIIFFQETHLWPKQEDAMRLPDDWSFSPYARPADNTTTKQHGGIGILHRAAIPLDVRQDLSTPDVLVVSLHSLRLVNVYLPPENSPTLKKAHILPEEHLVNTMETLSEECPDPIIALGDFNARTGSNQIEGFPHLRVSEDATISTRGRRLLASLSAIDCAILNGSFALTDPAASSRMTSFQTNGRAVVDYAIANAKARDVVASFSVEAHIPAFSDHALLALRVVTQSPIFSTTPLRSKLRPSDLSQQVSQQQPPTQLDTLLHKTISSIPSTKSNILSLYGPAGSHSHPWVGAVAVAGNCTPDKEFAFAVVWEASDGLPVLSGILPGVVSAYRAQLCALVLTFRLVPPATSAVIRSASRPSIDCFGSQAPLLYQLGWSRSSSDVIVAGIINLQSRTAPIKLVESTKSDSLWSKAKTLACRFRSKSPPSPSPLLPSLMPDWQSFSDVRPSKAVPSVASVSGTPKISWVWLERPPPLGNGISDGTAAAHRGRVIVRKEALMNRLNLENASSPRRFWEIIKEYSGQKPRLPPFTVFDFEDVCIERMSTPATVPEEFCQVTLNSASEFLVSLPATTEDTTPERFFSAPWSDTEISELMRHLHAKGPGSATGPDGRDLTYEFMLSIQVDQLKTLYDECVSQIGTPHVWLTTRLVGILKRGKSNSDPHNFRIIALECCLLKGLTWLIERHIRQWAETRRIIPKIQNGFRPGRRTNDNAFILRTAAEWAISSRKDLYVAFIDLQNAFPSVNRAIMWKKLTELGATGPLIDFLRHLYAQMSYVVQLGIELSPNDFQNDIGILAGDPCSPILWLLFASDCKFPIDKDDVLLGASRVPALFFADDLGLISVSLQGLQRRIESVELWCSQNALQISCNKSKVMVIRGPTSQDSPRPIPRSQLKVTIGNTALALDETHATYVGVAFDNCYSHLFRNHIKTKARHAASMCHGIFAMHNICGDVPPSSALTLYMARVDPHLTHGCDVVIDTPAVSIKKLKNIQLSFLRRLLHVNPRSFKAMLFMESGIMPIREQRVLMSLQALRYYINDTNGSLVASAFMVSTDLVRQGYSSWLGDLIAAIARLNLEDISISAPTSIDWLLLTDNISKVELAIHKSVALHTYNRVYSCRRVPLLHLRAERLIASLSGSPISVNSSVNDPDRFLMDQGTPNLQYALMRLLLAEHGLRCEMGRRDLDKNTSRHCRLCGYELESEIHALFFCPGSPTLRDVRCWLEHVRLQEFPSLPSHVDLQDEQAGRMVLDSWLNTSPKDRRFWPVVAKMCRIVLSVFDAV